MKSIIIFALAIWAVASLRAFTNREDLVFHNSVGNLANIPQGTTNSPWGGNTFNNPWRGSTVNPTNPWGGAGANPNFGSNPLNNLWNRIPNGGSGTFNTNLANNPLNNLWGRIPQGSNVWNYNNNMGGINCPGVRMSVNRGGVKMNYNYEGPIRLTCQLPNRTSYSDSCSNASSCQQLLCRFSQCSLTQGGRVLKQRI
jgi:hypothetical protein